MAEFTLQNLRDELALPFPGEGCVAQANHDALAGLSLLIAESFDELPAESGWSWFFSEKHAARNDTGSDQLLKYHFTRARRNGHYILKTGHPKIFECSFSMSYESQTLRNTRLSELLLEK